MNHCISVKTNKEFFFGGAKIGFIKMTIDSITNLPKERKYNLVITDSCYKEVSERQPFAQEDGSVEMRDVIIQREIGSIVREDLSFGYEQLNALAQVLKIDKSQFESETDYINELFRQGLYVVTIQECKQGLLGVKGKGRYHTEAAYWSIVRE